MEQHAVQRRPLAARVKISQSVCQWGYAKPSGGIAIPSSRGREAAHVLERSKSRFFLFFVVNTQLWINRVSLLSH